MAEIHEQVCAKCGESVSGPDKTSVAETMKRHTAKKHPSSRKAANNAGA